MACFFRIYFISAAWNPSKIVLRNQRKIQTNWKVFTDIRACDRQACLPLIREYINKESNKDNEREKDKTKTMKKTNQLESVHGCKSMWQTDPPSPETGICPRTRPFQTSDSLKRSTLVSIISHKAMMNEVITHSQNTPLVFKQFRRLFCPRAIFIIGFESHYCLVWFPNPLSNYCLTFGFNSHY